MVWNHMELFAKRFAVNGMIVLHCTIVHRE